MTNTRRIAALLACLLLIVAVFTGCSSKYASVGEYLENDEVRAALDEEMAALEGTGVSMEVYADGNTLVYDCSYDTQLDLSDDAAKTAIVDALAAACEENSATYTDIAEALREVVDADDIKVQLIYRNADGSEIYVHNYE